MTVLNHNGLHDTVIQGIYADGYWGYEHAVFIQQDWIAEVVNQDTLQSYAQWVTNRIYAEEDSK